MGLAKYMDRPYQHDYSKMHPDMYQQETRARKARTMVAVLRDCLGELGGLKVLDTGSSTGVIDDYLAGHFLSVTGLDIDEQAIEFAIQNFRRDNLSFLKADAMALPFAEASFDVLICAHVYEHVPDGRQLMAEIHRVLKPGGVCYFAGGNKYVLIEPHYRLPLLSAMPRWLAHRYVRLSGKAASYYEKLLSLWGLRRLVGQFEIRDYTLSLLAEPERYGVEYMVGRKGSAKARLVARISRLAYWLCPTFIWVLRKK